MISDIVRWTCSIVECHLRKPNWWSKISFNSSDMGWSRLMSNFSNNLEIFGSKLIGRYEFASWIGFPGLWIRMMIVSKILGNTLNEALR